MTSLSTLCLFRREKKSCEFLAQAYLVAALATACSAASAGEISLQQALALATQSSPELQKSAAAADEAHWKKIDAHSAYLPRLHASVFRLLDKKYMYTDIEFGGANISIPNIVPSTIYGLNANWNLFDGFATSKRAAAGRQMEAAARRENEWANFKVSREVTLQFYRALAADSLRAVAESNLKTLRDHLHDVTLFRSSGLSTNYDVLRVEVQVSEAESELLNAGDNAELAKGKLAEIMGLDPQSTSGEETGGDSGHGKSGPESAQGMTLTGHLPELKAELLNQASRSGGSETSRADLEALGLRSEALGLISSADSRHWIPRLDAFGTYQYYNNLNDQLMQWNHFRHAYQVGLTLTWDLFDGFHSTAVGKEVAAQRAQSEKSLRQAQLKAAQDYAVWTRKFKYYCSVSKARQNDIGKAQESVRLAREGRKVGARTNTDLLDAEAELYRAEAGAISAQIGAIEALINVELSLGKKIYSFN